MLVCSKDKILSHKLIPPKITKNSEIINGKLTSITEGTEMILYYYIKDELTAFPNEDVSKRTKNSIHIKIGKNKYQAKFYTWNKFYKKDGKWYQVFKAEINPADWEKEMKT